MLESVRLGWAGLVVWHSRHERPRLRRMSDEGKKAEEVLRDMRAEIERAADKLKGAAHKAMERPETKELLSKADKFLGVLGKGADTLMHELQGEFKELATKLRDAAKERDKRDPSGGSGHQDGGGI